MVVNGERATNKILHKHVRKVGLMDLIITWKLQNIGA